MGKPRAPLDPVADLKRRLARAPVRTSVRAWWKDHDFADHPATVGKRVAIALLEQRMIAHKLAGVLVLQELGEQLRASDLAAFARLFEAGHIRDQAVVDPFATKVLATLLERETSRDEVAYTLATWRTGDTIWQRRAACLAFVRLASDSDADVWEAVLTICATVVWSHERLDQTAVGSVLR